MSDITRRNVLAGAAGVAGVAGLAACATGASTDPATEPATQSPTKSPAQASGEVIASVSDVPVGGGTIVDSGADKIVVTQATEGDIKAFSAVCPHQGCNCSAVRDGVIVCPCHGSQFAIADGAVVAGPAMQGLVPVEIRVKGSDVVLG